MKSDGEKEDDAEERIRWIQMVYCGNPWRELLKEKDFDIWNSLMIPSPAASTEVFSLLLKLQKLS